MASFALLVTAGASCRLGKATVPDFTSPAGFGQAISMSATPDLLQRDGRTTSTITISAYGASKPVAGLVLHLEIRLLDGTGGLGTLSTTSVTTGADGRAVATYTSPLPAPLGQSDDAKVDIVARPVGSDASNTTTNAVSIRLTSQDTIGGPTATFVFGPKSPKVGDTILFDASASQPSSGNSIVTYAWDFGDGNASPRVPYLTTNAPTMTHEYNKSGPFTVGLTILDSAGRRSNATFSIVVGS